MLHATIRFEIIILVLITLFELCATCLSYFRPISYDLDESQIDDFPWVVIIRNIHDKTDAKKLYYGSLINPWAVLTTSIVDSRDMIKKLRVYAHCGYVKLTPAENYSCRMFSDISDYVVIQDKDENGNSLTNGKKNNILILSEPFELNTPIDIIHLAKSYTTINPMECLMLFLKTLHSSKTNEYAQFVAPMKVYLENGTVAIYGNNTWIEDDRERKELLPIINNEREHWDFFGSPIACQLKNDLHYYVQVAVVNSGMLFNALHYEQIGKTSLAYAGSITNITRMFYLIRDRLMEYGIGIN